MSTGINHSHILATFLSLQLLLIPYTNADRRKTGKQSSSAILIGYSKNHKSYNLFTCSIQKAVIFRHALFDESKEFTEMNDESLQSENRSKGIEPSRESSFVMKQKLFLVRLIMKAMNWSSPPTEKYSRWFSE